MWGPVNPVGTSELLLGGCAGLSNRGLREAWSHGETSLRSYDPAIGPTCNFSDPLSVIELDHYRSPAFHEVIRRHQHRARALQVGPLQ